MKSGYLILGAGLAGLSAAYHLKEKNQSDWTILERTNDVGGLCKSNRDKDGFMFDQSIHILYSSDPYASGLIKKLLNNNMSVKKRESWVFSNGVYTPYPWQANTYGLPVKIIKECLLGVIKATYENKGRPNHNNFEDWCHATFGDGFAKLFMIPYNRKLWAIDLKQMSAAWIKDRVMTPALDEVIEGALHNHEKGFGPNAIFWYPKTGGIEALPRGFLPYLEQNKIKLNTEVNCIFWKEKKISTTDGRTWRYDKLILTLPLPFLARQMNPEMPPSLMDAVGRLEHNTVYAINLAIKRDELSPYHWVYFPEEKYCLHRISFPKNFSSAMVPDGWNSITVEVSASRHRKVLPKDKLIDIVLADLLDAGVIKKSDTVEVKSVFVLNPAYIIYNHTHRNNVDDLHEFLNKNEIFPCGRFGEWEYLNMDHSILSGKRTIDKILEGGR